MSELSVGSLKGLAANDFKIEVASGSQLVQPGSILQVVSVSTTNTFTTTSLTAVEITDLTASITPSSASSKVFVQCVIGRADSIVTEANIVSIFRGGSSIGSPIASSYADGGNFGSSIVVSFLDSPSSTSALSYAPFVNVSGGTGSFRQGTLTLMEVAG